MTFPNLKNLRNLSMKKPLIAITMGDIAGVGPEIIVKALAHRELTKRCRFLIIGSEQALQRAFSMTKRSIEYTVIESESYLAKISDITLLNDERFLGDKLPLGVVDPACGASAFAWLEVGIRLAQMKRVDAIVTAPIHKEALNQAGHHYAGHTEILAEKTDTKEFSLMLIAGKFRVVHVTCHVALSQVSPLLTRERISSTIHLFHRALSRLDHKSPRVAVCAFNPHAGEGGLFGLEELRSISPAIEGCKSDGIEVSGPFPSDSIYPQHMGGKFDGVVAMYHDQGHIPFKLANFGFDAVRKEWKTVTGVNVTLGLPIIRTSVDHGTAFDIVGTGKASEQSLLDAIDVALKLAAN